MAYEGPHPLPVPSGGTGDSSLTVDGVLYGNGTSPVNVTNAATQGDVLTATGSTPVFARTVTGTGNFTFQDVTAGDIGALIMHNADGTNTGSHAIIAASVQGAGGNPFIGATVSGSRFFSYGIIISDSDSWQLQTASNSAFVSGTLLKRMTTLGVQTMPLQPSFQLQLSGNVTNATGDGTTYHVAFDTIVFDQNSNITTGSSAVFTAPVTGKYLLSVTANVTNLSSGHTDMLVNIVTTLANNQQVIRLNPFPVYDSSGTAFSASRVCNMTAGNTAYVAITISGGTKTVTISGGASGTVFSGALLC